MEKNLAVQNENYDQARQIKETLEKLKQAGLQLKQMEQQKFMSI